MTLNDYDAVAYFSKISVVKGIKKYTAVHNNAIYQFNENPSKYESQFGGFCPYGIALGTKLKVNGKAFEIVDGKLYVNKNEDVYKIWTEDKQKHIIEANKKWAQI